MKEFKKILNKANNYIKQAKIKFYNNIEESLIDAEQSDKRKYWKLVKCFVKRNNQDASIPPLLHYQMVM